MASARPAYAAADTGTAIAEHNLKVFFGEPPERVDVDVSPSFAEGPTVQELLALEPGSRERLLGASLGHYTPDFGRGQLAEAIAALHQGVAAQDVLVLSGTDAAVFNTFAALASPGRRALVQSPCYPPLRNVAEWRGTQVVSWDPGPDGQWDLAATSEIQPGDLVVVCAPHSPFGVSPSAEWLRSLAKRAEAASATLIVDEVYRGIDLTADGSGLLPSACELSATAVIFGGLAKTYGLPGLRVGWLICRDKATRDRIERLSLNTNCNMSVPTELLGSIAVRHTHELLRRNASVARRNLEAVAGMVARSRGLFSWVRPTSGLVVWLRWHGPGNARELARSVLEHEHIMVADQTLFGMEDAPSGGGLRVGLGALDMPARLDAFQLAVQRYVESKRARASM